MIKQLVLLNVALLVCSLCAHSQVRDSDIVKATLGKDFHRLHPTMDSLKVWYHMHIDNNKANKNKGIADFKRIYSIEDGKGVVKVYAFKLDEQSKIEEIIINYRHDVKEHVEDAKKVKTQTSFHVGQYSTDLVFTRK
jgi:putative heme degradation protein